MSLDLKKWIAEAAALRRSIRERKEARDKQAATKPKVSKPAKRSSKEEILQRLAAKRHKERSAHAGRKIEVAGRQAEVYKRKVGK